MTELILNNTKLEFNCSSGIRNNGNGDYFDVETLELTPETMGEMALCKLTYMLINGYDACYDDIGDYMLDWSMDLPWTKNERNETKLYMKTHKYWDIIYKEFNNKYPDCEII